MSWEVGAVVVGVILGILGIVQYACNVLNYVIIQPFQKSINNLCEMVNEVRGVMKKLSERLEEESRASEARFIKLELANDTILHRLELLEKSANDS